MTETIIEYIKDYAPLVLLLIMMFIDRFGFGSLFSSFRSDITSAFNVSKLTESFNKLRDELSAVIQENAVLQEELKDIREALQRVKGGKK